MNPDCWGCGKKAPADGPLFLSCGLCKARKLIKCNFCSDACFKEHWPRHEKWHAEQAKNDKRMRETTLKVEWRPLPRGASTRVKKYDELRREADVLHNAADYHRAFKLLREAIELAPERPEAYGDMGDALVGSNDEKGAARYYLLAEGRCAHHNEYWAGTIATACNCLGLCSDAPRPSWWNDEDLLRLSAEAVAARKADDVMPLVMRADALYGSYTYHRTRTVAELREAARCFTRAAEIDEARGDTVAAETYRENAANALGEMRRQLEALVALHNLAL